MRQPAPVLMSSGLVVVLLGMLLVQLAPCSSCSSWAWIKLQEPAHGNGAAAGNFATAAKAGPYLRLRGGAELTERQKEEQLRQMQKDQAELDALLNGMESDIRANEAKVGNFDPFGESPAGNYDDFEKAQTIVSYPEPEDLDEIEPEPPKLENVINGMKMVAQLQEMLTECSPEGLADQCQKHGIKISELEPQISATGKRAGNLTDFELHRQNMLGQIDDIRATYAAIRHEMKQKQPVEELKEEIAQMREKGEVNPYIQLLHDWAKDKEHEHETGSFKEQFKARQKAMQKVDGIKAPEAPMHPVAPPQALEPAAVQRQ